MFVPTRLFPKLWPSALCLLLLFCTRVRADERDDARLNLTRLAGGVSLVEQTFVLEDPGGLLTLQDVMKPEAHFVRAEHEASFGFTQSAIWVRFEAVNPSERVMPWMLELAYPHLDKIDVYALTFEGTTRSWHAGDWLPFSAREVAVPNFVFPQESAPGTRTTFYLRVRSDGSVRIPLRAWLALDFVSHESQQNLLLWLFYGVVTAMTLYNIGTATLLKQREYVYYVGSMVTLGMSIFTLSGQTFQHFLPNHPALGNRALAFWVALGLLFVQLYARECLVPFSHIPQVAAMSRRMGWTLPPSVLVVAIALLAPQRYAQPSVFVGILLYIPFGIHHLLITGRYGGMQLRPYVLSFSILALSIPVALLAHAKVIPPYALAIWAGHIGCASHSLLMSLALPMRVSDLGRRLAGLNEQLSNNVTDLKQALARAEQATRVKDEFMATMSHELRTPLNAIINVPQGLLEDFPTAAAAVCSACHANFLLDPGDTVNADTSCTSCGRQGTLRAESATVYTGRPAHTARFLYKIERAGQNLLQMVNGVLDYSKMEAGRLELAREPIDLCLLISEVLDQMSDLAQRRGVTTELTTPGEAREASVVDPVRVRQVLMNLLTNAIKFSEPGGTIRVTWEQNAEADLISVADHGIGVAPENHQRIFASFEQVHKGDTRQYGGTGLGLSISRSLVRMHGGELWVESELGKGSTFRLTLPRNLAHASEVDRPAAKVA